MPFSCLKNRERKDCFAAAPEQKLFYNFFFVQKVLFILSFPCILRALSGSFSPRAQKARVGWAGTNFVIHFVANFVTNFVPKSPRNFSGLFSLPQKIHAKSTPPSGPKSTPILETFFSVVSPGARHWSASLLLDMLTNEDL